MKLSEIAREVISLAQAANQARLSVESDDDSPMVPSGDLATAKLTAEERRLHEFLETQPAAVVYMLAALMYLGRGDFDTKADLLDRSTEISETSGDPKWAARRMFVTMPLAEFLEEGLTQLKEVGADVDELLPG